MYRSSIHASLELIDGRAVKADPNRLMPERASALRLARRLGCDGAHESNGGWAPCPTPDALAATIKHGAKGYERWKASNQIQQESRLAPQIKCWDNAKMRHMAVAERTHVVEEYDEDVNPARFTRRQAAMVRGLRSVSEAFGKFDQSMGPNGAHYIDRSPFAHNGMVCTNCAFYEGPRGCEVVEGDIAPDAICKLWVIPEDLIGEQLMGKGIGHAIGRLFGGGKGSKRKRGTNAVRKALKKAPLDLNARDADGDGFVQEGTTAMRRSKPSAPDAIKATERRARIAASAAKMNRQAAALAKRRNLRRGGMDDRSALPEKVSRLVDPKARPKRPPKPNRRNRPMTRAEEDRALERRDELERRLGDLTSPKNRKPLPKDFDPNKPQPIMRRENGSSRDADPKFSVDGPGKDNDPKFRKDGPGKDNDPKFRKDGPSARTGDKNDTDRPSAGRAARAAEAKRIASTRERREARKKDKNPFTDDKVVMPEDATPEQIAAAEKMRDAIIEGKKTEVPNAASVLVLKSLSDFVAKEREMQKKDPKYVPHDINLCAMTVRNTNLFCMGNKDIPRDRMPQLVSQIRPGSPAEQYAKDHPSAVFVDKMVGLETLDASGAFEDALAKKGMKVTPTSVAAVKLKATQNELDGSKVVGITSAILAGRNEGASDEAREKAEGILAAPVYITKDGYVLDGHHRFAAMVASDFTEDGKPGDMMMNVREIDATIDQVLPFAMAWTENFGLATQSAKPSERAKQAAGKA